MKIEKSFMRRHRRKILFYMFVLYLVIIVFILVGCDVVEDADTVQEMDCGYAVQITELDYYGTSTNLVMLYHDDFGNKIGDENKKTMVFWEIEEKGLFSYSVYRLWVYNYRNNKFTDTGILNCHNSEKCGQGDLITNDRNEYAVACGIIGSKQTCVQIWSDGGTMKVYEKKVNPELKYNVSLVVENNDAYYECLRFCSWCDE